ncbi:MAG: DoxX family protein [Cyclobacteriaceae bacterium]|nr:DoxX family protein [Cyclobacteriaceae bacterium]UYN85866.1 MAG: DoxX family protein [Cyclobacteriaceae bacterium]
MKINEIIYWAARLIAAIIMLQTLYFKFTASEESVYIFTTVGMEPWGRYGTGIAELIASVLLLVNATAWLGAVLAFGIMAGAIVMHLTVLGVEVKGDGGQLFIYALLVLVSAGYILLKNKKEIISLIEKIKR